MEVARITQIFGQIYSSGNGTSTLALRIKQQSTEPFWQFINSLVILILIQKRHRWNFNFKNLQDKNKKHSKIAIRHRSGEYAEEHSNRELLTPK